jgi:hypothetical protein
MGQAVGDPTTARLPDFVVIGAQKSGTSTLHHWLTAHPDVAVHRSKCSHFFDADANFARGPAWYAGQFPAGRVLGEICADYTVDPDHADAVAARMVALIPEVRIVYQLRHPLERIRSHYRHEVVKGRERRSFAEAVAGADSRYVVRSLYFSCLEPFIHRFSRDQLCVIRLEAVTAPGHPAWATWLQHIGVAPGAPPTVTRNVTADKRGQTRVLARFRARKLPPAVRRLPPWARRLGARVVTTNSRRYRALMEGSERHPLPATVVDAVWSDVEKLEAWLGAPAPLWSR